MAEFAAAGEPAAGPTLVELLSPDELGSLITLKGLLAQYEAGEIVDDDDDPAPAAAPAPAAGSPTRPYRFSDAAVVRFLRGRKHDESKAFRALLRHLKWRAANNVAAITADMVKVEANQRKIVVHGKDREERPAIYIFAYRHKTSDRDINIMQQFIIYTLEQTMRLTKPTEEKLVIVFDLSDFTLACMDYEVVKMLVNILQFNYPEVLHTALVVNAPMIFSACWMVIRPWLDPVTAGKVQFVRKDEVSKYIDKKQMPPDFETPDKFDDDEDDEEGEEGGEGEGGGGGEGEGKEGAAKAAAPGSER